MRTRDTIVADLDKLRSARASGARRIQFSDREVEFRSDTEIARAIAALEAELETVEGVTKVRNIVVRPAAFKGW